MSEVKSVKRSPGIHPDTKRYEKVSENRYVYRDLMQWNDSTESKLSKFGPMIKVTETTEYLASTKGYESLVEKRKMGSISDTLFLKKLNVLLNRYFYIEELSELEAYYSNTTLVWLKSFRLETIYEIKGLGNYRKDISAAHQGRRNERKPTLSVEKEVPKGPDEPEEVKLSDAIKRIEQNIQRELASEPQCQEFMELIEDNISDGMGIMCELILSVKSAYVLHYIKESLKKVFGIAETNDSQLSCAEVVRLIHEKIETSDDTKASAMIENTYNLALQVGSREVSFAQNATNDASERISMTLRIAKETTGKVKRVEEAYPDVIKYAIEYTRAVKLSNDLVRVLSVLKEGVNVPKEVSDLTVLGNFEVFYKNERQRGEEDSYVQRFIKAVKEFLPMMRFVGDGKIDFTKDLPLNGDVKSGLEKTNGVFLSRMSTSKPGSVNRVIPKEFTPMNKKQVTELRNSAIKFIRKHRANLPKYEIDENSLRCAKYQDKLPKNLDIVLALERCNMMRVKGNPKNKMRYGKPVNQSKPQIPTGPRISSAAGNGVSSKLYESIMDIEREILKSGHVMLYNSGADNHMINQRDRFIPGTFQKVKGKVGWNDLGSKAEMEICGKGSVWLNESIGAKLDDVYYIPKLNGFHINFLRTSQEGSYSMIKPMLENASDPRMKSLQIFSYCDENGNVFYFEPIIANRLQYFCPTKLIDKSLVDQMVENSDTDQNYVYDSLVHYLQKNPSHRPASMSMNIVSNRLQTKLF